MRRDYRTLSLSRQVWNLPVCYRCVLTHRHLFEFDSSPKYFTITLIYNEKPSDSHWVLGYSRFESFYPLGAKGNSTFLGKYTRKFRGDHSHWCMSKNAAGVDFVPPRVPTG
ncbi:hypothetical protein AVEN_224258-1 [Araneus ventricosus]|uniref:Uncharacterized protein n=1 Tax=Araneus ventricosus TaxID=182803 RepID=A0A4Y2UYI4_ARAVE|nr:hypothetical protein AVEN_224258-1 [Araneus ventricosus]